MANPRININRSLWKHVTSELCDRGRGRHETGCFLLGTVNVSVRTAIECVFYDELDSNAYTTGVCVLDGDAFSRLWDICRQKKRSVIADVHTHPGLAYQSESDRTNPMIARNGHVGIILPRFAFGWMWRHRIGLYQYKGDHRWVNLSGWKARRHLKIGRSWI